MFMGHARIFFSRKDKKKLKKNPRMSRNMNGFFSIVFLVLYFSTHVLGTCVGTYATLKCGNLNCHRFSRLHNHGFIFHSAFEFDAVLFSSYTLD